MTTDMGIMTTDMGIMTTDMGIMTTDMGIMTTDMGIMTTDMGRMTTDIGIDLSSVFKHFKFLDSNYKMQSFYSLCYSKYDFLLYCTVVLN